jgi:hypothetical protein
LEKLKNIYEDYLKSIGKFDPDIRFGRKESKAAENKEVIELQSRALAERLKERFKFNNRIILIGILLLCLLFILGIVIIILYRDFLLTNRIVLGFTFFSFFPIVYYLRMLWWDKCYLDISLSVIEGLPPQQAADFISVMYWKLRSRS